MSGDFLFIIGGGYFWHLMGTGKDAATIHRTVPHSKDVPVFNQKSVVMTLRNISINGCTKYLHVLVRVVHILTY